MRRTFPLAAGDGIRGLARSTCVVPYKGATQIAEPSASFPHTTQIVSESFASRALASHHSPTQIGASHPTQIAFSVLVNDQTSRNQSGGERPKRVFHCKKCNKNHPGKDCEGKLVTCRYCQKLGHREYECYWKSEGKPPIPVVEP